MIPLGNAADGWDEPRAEQARKQLLAKIELGLWTPRSYATQSTDGIEPTIAELATDWLADRELNPAIRTRTTDDDRWRITRYLLPAFGQLRPSQISPFALKQYRRQIHRENGQIQAAQQAGAPLRDPRTGQPLRPLSNDSINKTLRTLALILDDAEDAGWVTRNVARGRRMREPVERRKGNSLETDELLTLFEAAGDLDHEVHRPDTLVRSRQVRALRDQDATWKEIAAALGVAPSTAIYLYHCDAHGRPASGPRRAVIATLAFTGLRVSELCALNNQDIQLGERKIHVRDAKTPSGVRSIDVRPRLLNELTAYRGLRVQPDPSGPAFPTRTGARRDRNNVRARIIVPVLRHANSLRASRGQAPIIHRVTPHTFRRTFITLMLAAGFDLPYIQDQAGHREPHLTLAIYAQVIRRSDRDALRAEVRELLGEDPADTAAPRPTGPPPRSRWARHTRYDQGREEAER